MESTDSNAIKDPRVRAAIEHYLLDLESTTPPNTLRNYKPKQKEWQDSHTHTHTHARTLTRCHPVSNQGV
ncbi:hypothetical protein EDB80DRAFT_734957 [Ilyonectria destructans]|nr:hypothetical protein EDB80DRAFT_734957 [Ilyonectria destructans]